MATPIDFVLTGLDTSFAMSENGQLAGEAVASISANAVAEVDVALSFFTNTFKYKRDSIDVTDAAGDDIEYYVYKSGWDGDVISPGDATVVTDPIFAGASASANLLKHDFVRYLAVKLFNTHHGVDLFSNEEDLLLNIVTNGKLVNGYIRDILDVVDVNKAGGSLLSGNVPLRYQTNSQDGNTNFSRILMRQMMYTNEGKARFSAIAATPADANAIRSIPFAVGDSVSFVLTVNPNTDQQKLTAPTSTTQIPGRTYQIKMKITA